MRKDVAMVRKKIDMVNKELKPLGQTCQKKVTFLTVSYANCCFAFEILLSLQHSIVQRDNVIPHMFFANTSFDTTN